MHLVGRFVGRFVGVFCGQVWGRVSWIKAQFEQLGAEFQSVVPNFAMSSSHIFVSSSIS